MKCNSKYYRMNRRLKRLEAKVDRIIIEIGKLQRRDPDNVIDAINRTARVLRQQARREREHLQTLYGDMI